MSRNAPLSPVQNRISVIVDAEPCFRDTGREILSILDDALHLGGRAAGFDTDTPLLGALPELDSMAVVGLITRIQERFGFVIEDDEIEGATFETVGSLTEFVKAKMAAGRLP